MNRQVLIAIVDDEPSVCRALARLVRSHGMRAETFSDGQAFLARLEGGDGFEPECVLLDIHMPGFSGLDVQAELNRLGRALPIVFITAHDVPQLRDRAMAAGAVTVLQKPIRDDALFRAIQDAGAPLH